jgi:rRNA-processing protein FCF1
MACPFFFVMAATLSNDTLELLVRALTPQQLWEWLSHDTHLPLRARITQGFRENSTALRQPIARKRLVKHLDTTPDDAQSLMEAWSQHSQELLEAVRRYEDDIELTKNLPALQKQYGEVIGLALVHEEREIIVGIHEASEYAQGDSKNKENTAAVQKQLQRTQKKAEELRSKLQESKASANATEKRLQEKLRLAESQAREAVRTARQAELKLEFIQEKFAALEKEQDRAERKARKALSENVELQAETKNLRRQIHRLQQIGEELRGKLAAAQNPPATESVSPATPLSANAKKQAPAVKPATPAVCDVKQIQAAIDRNDEIFVANLRHSLETLEQQNPATHKKLMGELRKLGRYYERVLRQSSTRVLVDASNIARHDGPGRGKLKYLHAMRSELQRFDFFPIVFVADASLPYHIDEPDEFRRMMKAGQFMVSASGQEADEILARLARETGAYVVTNDRRFHHHLAPAFTPLRIGFRIEEDVVMLDEF